MTAVALRYRAFLSYCHRDGVATSRLHKRLETYSVPRALRGTNTAGRRVPARIHPVFRDRDELASASQLSRSIEEALDASEALVVVCSPAAVASPWVNAEIAYFRRMHPERPVLAFVVAGDPGLDPRRDPARAAFPPSLVLADPARADSELGEPIAADAREEADGFSSAFLKLAAGLLGVRYDQLRRRDQRRRQLRWMLASAVASVLAAVFALLAWQATLARDAARIAQAQAEFELQSERQTRDFLLSVFQLADATEARGNEVTVREVLDRAVDRIDRTTFNRSVVRSRFLATMGQAYSSLGLNRRSIELLRASIQTLGTTGMDAESRTQRVDSRITLADTLFDMGEYDAAISEVDAASTKDVEVLARDPLRRAHLANIRGDVLAYQERDADAEAAYREALARVALARAEPDVLARARGRALYGIATLALFADDAVRAEQGYAETEALLTQAVGETHPDTISAILSHGSAAYRAEHRDVARASWTRALALAERVYDADSPQIGTIKNNLGLLLLEEGDLDAAEPLLRDALASDRRHRSEDFDDLAYPLHNLGALHVARGEWDAALPLLEEGVRIADAKGHRMQAPLLAALADVYCQQGRSEAGLPLARRAVAIGDADGEAQPWRRAQARITLASCRVQAGESVARAEITADWATLQKRWSSANPFVQRARAQRESLAR